MTGNLTGGLSFFYVPLSKHSVLDDMGNIKCHFKDELKFRNRGYTFAQYTR